MWNPGMKSVLQGLNKINAQRLTSLNMNKNLQKGEENEQLKPKYNARRMITHYKTGQSNLVCYF